MLRKKKILTIPYFKLIYCYKTPAGKSAATWNKPKFQKMLSTGNI